MDNKKTVFSGIQPSGKITLGNYLGAVKNWVSMQDEYNCIFSVVDMHAITVRQNPADLRRQTLELYAQLISCGIDPVNNDNTLLFIQSHVPQHAELSWILNCYTMFGELSRMTQFKDKSAKNADNINAGLFTYPVLMASDILLYQTDAVPVGEDQKQHVEICRDVATRFNGVYGDVFKIPEPIIPKVGARIMSLAEPERKMSKSDSNENAFILLMDKPDVIARKFKRAVTDSDTQVIYKEGKLGINNLMTIYSIATGKNFQEIEAEFDGKGYGEFKSSVGEAVVEMLRPLREKTEDLLKNKDYLESLYKESARKASWIAQKTLSKVQRKIGFIERKGV
ncbi:MAG: tryptophan--tRNA ligase [Bacillota bacterium]|nr:tryptophan--tRNA ligase [Bacillota bacterium]